MQLKTTATWATTDDTPETIRAVKIAQVEGILAFGYHPHIVNAGVCITVMLTHGRDPGSFPLLPLWALLNALSLVLRGRLQWQCQRALEANDDPERMLWRIAAGAFLGGLIWAVLPFCIPGINLGGRDTDILLFLLGVSVGSMVRGIPNSVIASAFSLPPMFSIALFLSEPGDLKARFLAVNVLILGFLIFKACRISEKNFIFSVKAQRAAATLARSLQIANADIKSNNQRLEVLASRDPLTGLANRGKFNEQLRQDIETANAEGMPIALLMLDLDGFKAVNDTLGHAVGDQLLIEIADRLMLAVENQGLAARLGGDEFSVICSGPSAIARAETIAQNFLDLCAQPKTIRGKDIALAGSIGIACYPKQARNAEELVTFADLALYEAKARAKASGRSTWGIFSDSLRAHVERQRCIELDLQHGIETGAVQAWFQPQFQLADRALIGFEALVRWQHPDLGAVAPEEIVRAAQAMHLSPALTGRMADQSCVLLNWLSNAGMTDVSVSINVSPREFSLYSVAEMLTGITAWHGIDPSRFEVEFTEETLLEPDLIRSELLKLEKAGYRLTVDDFGMGHSSLSYLLSMKIDCLKIDRSFIRNLCESRQNQALVSAMIGLGNLLNITVIVEGIETEADVQVLQTLGCTKGQGYAFARPMPPATIQQWLTESARDSA